MNNKLNMMLITNNIDIAAYASACGVTRLFVDLEINGKYERQGHLDTVISHHSMSDVEAINKVKGEAELLVRLNPYHIDSEQEINSAIEHGADIIMLPMFRTIEEVSQFSELIAGRVKFIPLIETIDAANIVSDIVKIKGVSEVYFGLNDLHREMGCKFMFEPLQNGCIEALAKIVTDARVPFGFGGIARVGEGMLPAELILSEHARLGSSNVILSRTFHRNSTNLDDLKMVMDLQIEVKKLLDSFNEHISRKNEQVTKDKLLLDETITTILNG